MAKKILTQQNLDENPDLVIAGYKAGDEIEVEELATPETEETDENNFEDEPGGNHPPGPPKKP